MRQTYCMRIHSYLTSCFEVKHVLIDGTSKPSEDSELAWNLVLLLAACLSGWILKGNEYKLN